MPLPKPNYFHSNQTDAFEKRLKEVASFTKVTQNAYKVTLIIPPSPQQPTPGREFLISGPFEGFTYIATLVKKMGYDVDVVDCRLKNNLEDLVLEAVKDSDLITLASFCDSFVFLEEITEAIKKHYPEKLILLGGPLVTSLPEILLQNTGADCAILGEAELTMIEFFERFNPAKRCDFTNIKGIAYKNGGHVMVNTPRPQIKDLDCLPFLDYTIWPSYENILEKGQILISSTRGCPQQCSFCFKTIPQLRLKSIAHFEKEVAYLKETTNFDYTWLNDLTFNVQEERAAKICDILKKYGVRYHVFARVKNVHKPLMDKLKETGCLGIWFGFESYNKAVLDVNRKNISIESINEALQVASNAGLAVRGLFIVGLYKETEESLREMLNFIESNDNFLPLVKYLTPFPGTSIYHHAVKTGKIKDVPGFLRMLSRRIIRDNDDEIINMTELDEDTLRFYFRRIWEITKARETREEYCL